MLRFSMKTIAHFFHVVRLILALFLRFSQDSTKIFAWIHFFAILMQSVIFFAWE